MVCTDHSVIRKRQIRRVVRLLSADTGGVPLDHLVSTDGHRIAATVKRRSVRSVAPNEGATAACMTRPHRFYGKRYAGVHRAGTLEHQARIHTIRFSRAHLGICLSV